MITIILYIYILEISLQQCPHISNLTSIFMMYFNVFLFP